MKGLRAFAAVAILPLVAGCSRAPEPVGPAVLWRDPGPVSQFDFACGVSGCDGRPQAPFRFVREDLRGNSPKVFVTDARGTEWRVKGGPEARPEAFAARLVPSVGYFAEITHFFASGRMEHVGKLKRASGFIQNDGSFTYASFSRLGHGNTFSSEKWTWSENPFRGSAQLNGLKIMVMLLSNWDNKDASDRLEGSNVAVLQHSGPDGPARLFFVNDWGQSLGAWGSSDERSNWTCPAFTAQTPAFVKEVNNGHVRFGYEGQHTHDFDDDIVVSDVAWLLRYLGAVTDDQLRAGLRASGASEEEMPCFTNALRARIDALRRLAMPSAAD